VSSSVSVDNHSDANHPTHQARTAVAQLLRYIAHDTPQTSLTSIHGHLHLVLDVDPWDKQKDKAVALVILFEADVDAVPSRAKLSNFSATGKVKIRACKDWFAKSVRKMLRLVSRHTPSKTNAI